MSSLLALLFFVLGMILLSRLEIGNFFTRLGNLNSNKTGYTNSFLLGFLTVIVATPCTGPYMGAAIGWGIAQPALISTSIFLSLGLGIAFPTLILSSFCIFAPFFLLFYAFYCTFVLRGIKNCFSSFFSILFTHGFHNFFAFFV